MIDEWGGTYPPPSRKLRLDQKEAFDDKVFPLVSDSDSPSWRWASRWHYQPSAANWVLYLVVHQHILDGAQLEKEGLADGGSVLCLPRVSRPRRLQQFLRV